MFSMRQSKKFWGKKKKTTTKTCAKEGPSVISTFESYSYLFKFGLPGSHRQHHLASRSVAIWEAAAALGSQLTVSQGT